jgi:membrane-bound serine protease (ClpP class)
VRWLVAGAVVFGAAVDVWADIPVVDLTGVIHGISAEYVVNALDQAERDQAPLVIIRIDTPGGLDTSMRQIIDHMLNSPVPVAVFVGPSGARAASAGFLITICADVAVMAPGTNMGAAHPVLMVGHMDETMSKKVASDAAAYIRSKAAQRGRNVEAAEKAVLESKSFTDREALKAGLIDFIAKNEAALVARLDGRTIKRFDGSEVTLHLKGQALRHVKMTTREVFLSTIARPEILFLLLLGALVGIGTEISHPGLLFPGILGAVSLVAFLVASQIIPINWAGVLLILVAIGLFVAEVKVTSYGLLTVGGLVAMILGAMILVDTSRLTGVGVPWSIVLPAAVAMAAWVIIIVRLVVGAQRARVTTGSEGLVGETGQADTDIDPEGWVILHGERWRARSHEQIHVGDSVVVTEVTGLRVQVRKGGV